jgi:hypothetical protein
MSLQTELLNRFGIHTAPATTLSPKVIAAAAGAGAGSVISQLRLWLLGAGVWHAGWSADRVDNALAAVPLPVYAFVTLVVTVAGAAIPGYQTADPDRFHTVPDVRPADPADTEVIPDAEGVGEPPQAAGPGA